MGNLLQALYKAKPEKTAITDYPEFVELVTQIKELLEKVNSLTSYNISMVDNNDNSGTLTINGDRFTIALKNSDIVDKILIVSGTDTISEIGEYTFFANLESLQWTLFPSTYGHFNGNILNITKLPTEDQTILITAENYRGTTCTKQIKLKKQEVEEIKVLRIYVLSNYTSLSEKQDLELTTTIYPEDATNLNIDWISSSPLIAYVTEGVLHTLTSGSTTITAISKDGSNITSNALTFTVNPATVDTVSSITLNKSEAVLNIGETLLLEATTVPINGNISYYSSRPKSVLVDSKGLITAVSEGESTIYAVSGSNGVKAKCIITVEPAIENSEDCSSTEGGVKSINLFCVLSSDSRSINIKEIKPYLLDIPVNKEYINSINPKGIYINIVYPKNYELEFINISNDVEIYIEGLIEEGEVFKTFSFITDGELIRYKLKFK